MKSKEKESIEEAKQELEDASGKLAQKLYSAQPGAEQQAETSATADDVVDADFKEVKDEDKS